MSASEWTGLAIDHAARVRGRADPLLREWADASTGALSGGPLVGDFGDAIPFFHALGRRADPGLERWALDQTDRCLALLRNFGRRAVNLLRYSDTVLGMGLMAEAGHAGAREFTTRFLDFLWERMRSRDGFLVSHRLPPGLRVPLSSGTYTGVYLEEHCRMAAIASRSDYLERARSLAGSWLRHPFFRERGLFPFPVVRAGPPGAPLAARLLFRRLTGLEPETVALMKNNVNLAFGLLRVARDTGDAESLEGVRRWVESLRSTLAAGPGLYCAYYSPRQRRGWSVSLESHNSLLDLFLDLHLHTRRAGYLDMARETADAWLALRAPSGLVPNGARWDTLFLSSAGLRPVRRTIPASTSMLDAQTDFAVALAKLGEVSREEKYAEASRQLTRAILRHHRTPHGFAEFVDTRTGRVSGHRLRTKYWTLLLKLLVYQMALEGGESALKDPALRDLIRDR